MRWRVGLVDSCGIRTGALETARFDSIEGSVCRVDPQTDLTGHGTRIADVIAADRDDIVFVLAQVFGVSGRTSAAVVAAAIDWCVGVGVDLVHLSLGVPADRSVLADAVGRAIASGTIVVASVPARGAIPFPAAYPGVIRGTGDARCAPAELSMLDASTFGGCPLGPGGGGGASIGAAHVTRVLTSVVDPASHEVVLAALSRHAAWRGPERRG